MVEDRYTAERRDWREKGLKTRLFCEWFGNGRKRLLGAELPSPGTNYRYKINKLQTFCVNLRVTLKIRTSSPCKSPAHKHSNHRPGHHESTVTKSLNLLCLPSVSVATMAYVYRVQRGCLIVVVEYFPDTVLTR